MYHVYEDHALNLQRWRFVERLLATLEKAFNGDDPTTPGARGQDICLGSVIVQERGKAI